MEEGDKAMLRDKKGILCWVFSICSSRSTFHFPTLLFATGGGSDWTASKIPLAFCFLIGFGQWQNQAEHWDGVGGVGKEENEVKVCIISAFPQYVCFRLAVTLDSKLLLLSRSWILSRWSLYRNTAFQVSSHYSLPSSFSFRGGKYHTVTSP